MHEVLLLGGRGMASEFAGVRAYLRRLRERKKLNQEELGDVMGISRRTVIDWESGKTRDISLIPLARAMKYFGAPWDHLQRLIDSDAPSESGAALADAWLAEQSEQVERILGYDGEVDLIAEIRKLRGDVDRLQEQASREQND